MKKYISILGSTGSIGRTSLEIINKKKKLFKPYIFSANKKYSTICHQILKYKPVFFLINNRDVFFKVKKKFKNSKTIILNSFHNLNIKKKSDITITAIPGISGLEPTLKMIKLSKKILIANKESVICGWELIKRNSLKGKGKIIPVDSEHFSILQLIKNEKIENIRKIYLTASGGPFLNYTVNQLKKVKPKDALKHPKWKMGKKITIDSSTLMNKIFEIAEAQKLFNLNNEILDIVIHPNSLVHAIIEFKNGIKTFIYHDTSMIIPLANAIFDGDLDIKNFHSKKFKNKKDIENLIFKKVDQIKFPAIKLKNKINEYPSSSIIINASNEVLVDQFLRKKIPYLSIIKFIMTILKDRNYLKYAIRKPVNIKIINVIDKWARVTTIKKLHKYA
jgi:1-deoxy-D-xylulose-5-phosphate reductoisomerase